MRILSIRIKYFFYCPTRYIRYPCKSTDKYLKLFRTKTANLGTFGGLLKIRQLHGHVA